MTTERCLGADPAAQHALLGLLRRLRQAGYAFVPATPETHASWLARHPGPATTLRGVFGWSQPFDPQLLGDRFRPLRDARVLEPAGDLWRSRVRVASLGEDLFLHSAFPTDGDDAVFLGPDTYRFVSLLGRAVRGDTLRRVVDLGAGAGAGGLKLARFAQVQNLVLNDVNPQALALARINARFADLAPTLAQGDAGAALTGEPDLVIGNPPFIIGAGKAYSDGGDDEGIGVAREWAELALERLAPGGRLLLYTGAPIVGGRDPLRTAMVRLAGAGATLSYEEIDPDIFGDERLDPAYAEVERLAAVAVDIRKR